MAINTAASPSPPPCPIKTLLRPCTPSSFHTRASSASPPHALAPSPSFPGCQAIVSRRSFPSPVKGLSLPLFPFL
jgi:hypothetical protein